MAFSFQRIVDFLDTQPEAVVMRAISTQYETNRRGLFSPKFIPYMDVQIMGYKGFKAMLTNLYELDPDFVEFNKQELYELVRYLKGE